MAWHVGSPRDLAPLLGPHDSAKAHLAGQSTPPHCTQPTTVNYTPALDRIGSSLFLLTSWLGCVLVPEGVLGSCSGSGGGRGKRVDKKATDTAAAATDKRWSGIKEDERLEEEKRG